MKQNGASRSQGALINMWGRQYEYHTGLSTKFHPNRTMMDGKYLFFIFVNFLLIALMQTNGVYADDNQRNSNEDLIQGYSLGPEIATTEFGKYK